MTYTIEQIRAALAGNTAASGGLIGYRIALMDCLAHIDEQKQDIEALIDDAVKQQAEIERLRTDAQRYRKMRSIAVPEDAETNDDFDNIVDAMKEQP